MQCEILNIRKRMVNYLGSVNSGIPRDKGTLLGSNSTARETCTLHINKEHTSNLSPTESIYIASWDKRTNGEGWGFTEHVIRVSVAGGCRLVQVVGGVPLLVHVLSLVGVGLALQHVFEDQKRKRRHSEIHVQVNDISIAQLQHVSSFQSSPYGWASLPFLVAKQLAPNTAVGGGGGVVNPSWRSFPKTIRPTSAGTVGQKRSTVAQLVKILKIPGLAKDNEKQHLRKNM